MRRLTVLLLLLLAPVAAEARSVADAPAELSASTRLAPAGEPGEALLVEGTVVDPHGKPIGGAVVYAFHTDATGRYGPEGDSTRSRLHGFVRTDADGHFTLRTIMPGRYPGQHVPAHIHVELAAGGRTFADECWFAGDPELDEELVERQRARGRLSAVLERKRERDGWRVAWTIEIAAPRYVPVEGAALLGTPAPELRGLRWVQGGPLTLAGLRGKPVLIRFWTDGCGYCRQAAPILKALAARYRERGLVVIGIHHPKAPDADAARGARELALDFPVATDAEWQTVRAFGVGTTFKTFTSVSFLIDAGGVIRFVHDGGAYDEAAQDELRAAIERALPR